VSDEHSLTSESLQDYSDFHAEQETQAEKYAEFVSNKGPNLQKSESPQQGYQTPYARYQQERAEQRFYNRQHLHRHESQPDSLKAGGSEQGRKRTVFERFWYGLTAYYPFD
jgi:hypothetical protein